MIAVGVSTASSAPWCSTAIRCARPVTTSMWCSTISTVLPSAWTERISSTSSGTFSIDTPAIGSSSRITRGVAGQHHRELELALVAVREQAGRQRRPRLEPDAAERPVRPLDRGSRRAFACRQMPHRPTERRLRGEPDVLEHRQQREHVRHLERAAEPGAGAPERRLGA